VSVWALFNEGANWLDAELGIDSANELRHGPDRGGCEQGAGAVVIGGASFASDGAAEGLGPALAAAENAGGGLASDLALLAEQHITDTGDTVLGRFPATSLRLSRRVQATSI
jgi:hypothetical protein